MEDLRNYLEVFMYNLDLPEESREDLRNNYKMFCDNEEAVKLQKQAEGMMFDGADWRSELVPYMDIISEKTGLHRYVVDFLFMVMASEELRCRYEEAGLPESLFWDTIADLKYKLLECYNVYGIWGTFVAHWHPRFYRMGRFKLGRMQYEVESYKGPEMTLGPYTIKPGDKAFNFHIPSCGPMGRDLRMDSYKKAYEFYKMEGPMIFICHSWLLYPLNKEILPEGSNVADFIDDFCIYEWEETDFSDRWRVFGADAMKADEDLPEDTTMRRCFKKWLLDGKRTGVGAGVFIYDGVNFYN